MRGVARGRGACVVTVVPLVTLVTDARRVMAKARWPMVLDDAAEVVMACVRKGEVSVEFNRCIVFN